MSLPVTLTAGNLPPNYCFSSLQQLLNDFTALLTGTVSVGTSLNVMQQPTPPGAQYQGNTLWVKTDTLGNPIRNYTYANGYWLSAHPIPPGSQVRQMWVGQETDLWNYDGGDGTDPNPTDAGYVAPTLYTGAMWKIDPVFTFKFPLGVGYGNSTSLGPNAYSTLYNGASAATILAQGATGGAENVTLAMSDMWHRHGMFLFNNDEPAHQRIYLGMETAGGPGIFSNVTGIKSPDIVTGTVTQSSISNMSAGSGAPGTDSAIQTDVPVTANPITNVLPSATITGPSAHSTMPPYIVVGYIMRTARAYYTGS